MTAEYLDRSSLVARMKYYEKHTTEESGEHYAYSVALREIRNAPAADVFKNVMKEDYARVLRCKDCKYGSYDSKPNGAMICLRTNDGFWRKETDFCSYGERREGGNDDAAD